MQVPTIDQYQVGISNPSPTTLSAPVYRGGGGAEATAMGKAAQGISDDIARVALDLQQEHVKALTKERDNQLSDAYRDILNNPEKGYLTLQGGNAVSQRDATIEALRKARQRIDDGIHSDFERNLFSETADRREMAAMGQIDAHTGQQLKVYSQDQTAARIKTSLADALANYGGWNTKGSLYEVARNTMVSEVQQLAASKGMSPESATLAQNEALATLHADVIGMMVQADSPTEAKSYFEKNLAEITAGAPDKVDNLKKLIEQGNTRDQSLRLSMSLTGGVSERLKTLDSMFQDGKINAEVYDATVQRVEHYGERLRANRAESERAILGQAQDWALKNPTLSIQDMPPALYNALKNEGRLEQIQSFLKNGRFVTDPKALVEVYSLTPEQLSAMTPEEFGNKYWGRLSPQDMEQGLALVAKHNGSTEPKHLELSSANDLVKAAAIDLGILAPDGKKDSKSAKDFSRFESIIQDRIRMYEDAELGGKRKANNDEIRKIITEVKADKVYRSNFFTDDEKPVALLNEYEMKEAYVKVGDSEVKVSSIPEDDVKYYSMMLRRKGITPTQKLIAKLYMADLKGGAK